MKGNARKVRRLYDGKVLAGFAGGTADAFTLFERFEAKLQKHGNLTRAAIELAKDWRTDRSLRRLEALLFVADAKSSFIISGNGDVIEPEDDIDRDRLGRRVRAGRGARAAAEHGARRARDRREGAGHRGGHLHLHEPEHHDRGTAKRLASMSMTPREIVEELDKHIIGQNEAKRAVAIALRNRWRRMQMHRKPAQRDHAEEHPDDRPDRRRQDRDRAPAREARARAVHQGRGDEVHRGRLRRPRRRLDHPRPRRHGGEDDARGRDGEGAASRGRCSRGSRARRAAAATAVGWASLSEQEPAPREPRRGRNSARCCAKASSTTARSRSTCAPCRSAWRSWRPPAWKR